MTAAIVALVVIEQVVLLVVVIALDAITAWRTRAVEDATAEAIARWMYRTSGEHAIVALAVVARDVREGRWRDVR